MNRTTKLLLCVLLLLAFSSLASWLLKLHETNLYSDTLDGAHCGNHVCTNSEERDQYINNYQDKEHVDKDASIVTAVGAGLVGAVVIWNSARKR